MPCCYHRVHHLACVTPLINSRAKEKNRKEEKKRWTLPWDDSRPRPVNVGAFFNHFVPALGHQEPWASDGAQNLTDNETLKRTCHNTAARCHDNGIHFTPVVFDGPASGWSSARSIGHLLPLTAHPTTSKLDLRVNLVLLGSFSKVLEKEVAKRLPHVVVKLFPNCVFHYVQARWWWKRRGRRSAAAFGGQRT